MYACIFYDLTDRLMNFLDNPRIYQQMFYFYKMQDK